MSRPLVSITYCADCGYDTNAIELAGSLLREFGHELSSLAIIPWSDGTFDVMIDETLVHSMTRDGGFPEPSVIAAALRARMAGNDTDRSAG